VQILFFILSVMSRSVFVLVSLFLAEFALSVSALNTSSILNVSLSLDQSTLSENFGIGQDFDVV
jgi:hypothetical protein